MSEQELRSFAKKLAEINAVKFGEFKTKVGIMTPVYCDLRVIVSYPELMKTLSTLLIGKLKSIKDIDIICGVPYTALPIATALSLETGVPMVMRRKEAKSYGTKKLIEGVFKESDRCLIVEDVVTSGSSILETVADLNNEGIKCKDAILLLNREQGGAKILDQHGIKIHSLYTLTSLVTYLKEDNLINTEMYEKVKKYIAENQLDESILKKEPKINRLKLSFGERSALATNPIASKLFKIMEAKKTTLCLAADVTDSTTLLNLAEQVGPHICVLKTHIDILDDFHPNFLTALKDIAKRHNFVLFEDRKFADIGKTVQLQYNKGLYNISSWAEIVTAHSVTGKGVLDAIKDGCASKNAGVFLLAETSAAGSLITNEYTNSTVKMALEYPDIVAGIVCQSPLFLENPGLIQLTPGVQIEVKCDNLGQQYNTPDVVILEKGGDIAVVGRGITYSPDAASAAQKYKEVLWDAYLKRIE